MIYMIVMYFLACLMDLITAKRMSGDEKDLEITLLRFQLRIVERRQERGPHIPRWQKIPLAVPGGPVKRTQPAGERGTGSDHSALPTSDLDQPAASAGSGRYGRNAWISCQSGMRPISDGC